MRAAVFALGRQDESCPRRRRVNARLHDGWRELDVASVHNTTIREDRAGSTQCGTLPHVRRASVAVGSGAYASTQPGRYSRRKKRSASGAFGIRMVAESHWIFRAARYATL